MIYKYLDENTLQPVTDKTLKFATIADLNDPFENLAAAKAPAPGEAFIKEVMDSPLAKDLSKYFAPDINLSDVIRERISAQADVFNGKAHYLPDLLLQIKMQEDVSKKVGFGVLSLTKNPKNSLMWSHYGNKHQGYVLGFDENHDIFQNNSQPPKYVNKLIPIDYKDERIRLDANMTEEESFKPIFQKSTDWHYEEEIRMIKLFRDCKAITPNIHIIEYPVDALKEVIFGFRCSAKVSEEIRNALSGLDVTFLRAVPSSITYNMEIMLEDDFYPDIDSLTEAEGAKLKLSQESLKQLNTWK